MSHFAQVVNGIVQRVIVADEEFIKTMLNPHEWVQTSYNTFKNQHPEGRPLRGNFAGIGFIYDKENDVFYEKQPYPSWVLNHSTWSWEAPVAKPDDGNSYSWDEESLSWKLAPKIIED